MNLPNLKDLKKLADTCRKAGIKHFKSAEFEFTLTEDIPQSNYKKAKAEQAPASSLDVESDMPNEDELLFWSAGQTPESPV